MKDRNSYSLELIPARNIAKGDLILEPIGASQREYKVLEVERDAHKHPILGVRAISMVLKEKHSNEERYFSFKPTDDIFRIITLSKILRQL